MLRWKSQAEARSGTGNIVPVAGRIPGIPAISGSGLQPNGNQKNGPLLNSLPSQGINIGVESQPGRASLLPDSHGRDTKLISANWDQQADVFLQQLKRLSYDRANSAAILLRQAANARRQGSYGESRTILSQAVAADGLYGLLARAEMQSFNGTATVPIPAINLPQIQTKPFLDADMADQCWQDATEIHLQSATAQNAPDCLVMLAWDAEFFYIAARVQFAADRSSRLDKRTPRRHDFDHGDHDQITISLDTDRDYTTAFSFTVDETGQTSERCWRSKKWNPDWFVAEAADQTAWRFEAAIPFAALGTPVRAGDLWVINIQRTLPGAVHQTLTNQAIDADGTGAEGFGLLRFIRRR